VFAGFGFGWVCVGGDYGFAFVPWGELVGIVGAGGLAGFAGGEDEDGVIPVGEVGDEAHGGAVAGVGGADAVLCAGLRFAGDAEERFEKTLAANGMEHVESIEFFPLPVFGAVAFGLFGEGGYGLIGSGGEELVVVFVDGG